MIPAPSVTCLDIRLQPSRYRLTSWLVMALVLGGVIGILPMTVTYRVGLIIVLGASLVLSQLTTKHLLALATVTQPTGKPKPISRLQEITWQFQWVQGYLQPPWGREQTLYEALVDDISHYGPVMVLKVTVMKPTSQRHQLIIWQDQIDTSSWRKLAILAQR